MTASKDTKTILLSIESKTYRSRNEQSQHQRPAKHHHSPSHHIVGYHSSMGDGMNADDTRYVLLRLRMVIPCLLARQLRAARYN